MLVAKVTRMIREYLNRRQLVDIYTYCTYIVHVHQFSFQYYVSIISFLIRQTLGYKDQGTGSFFSTPESVSLTTPLTTGDRELVAVLEDNTNP